MMLVAKIRRIANAVRTLADVAAATVRGDRTALAKFRTLVSATRVIRRSPLFDAEWYLKNNPDVAAAKMDPAKHYLVFGPKSGRNPSPYFVNDEYYALHNDVRMSKMNPLLHFERFGRREGRPISFLEVSDCTFPSGAQEGTWRFERLPRKYGRTAVVASFISNGRIPDTLVYLLRGLSGVADNIVLVVDAPVFPEETAKLRGLVFAAVFRRHGRYDFGSYRIGYEFAKEEGLLSASLADELVVMNDSNYGPVFPFGESFSKMADVKCDFWGYTGYNAFGHVHISSYFYLFRRSVIDSGKLEALFSEVTGHVERDKVIVKFEFAWTQKLQDAGFSWATLVPIGFKKGAPTKYPVSLCSRYRMPLLKVKAVNGDCFEDVEQALAIVQRHNPELRALIVPRKIHREHRLVGYAEHQAQFGAKCAAIAARVRTGGRIKAVFFVSSATMFPARPLFDAMLADARFDPYVCVIPDMRWRDGRMMQEMESCEQEIRAWYAADRLVTVRHDEFGTWSDVLEDADIVCYPSPYELSVFRYNPHYAVGRPFLPICVNYGYYRSVYDRIIMGGQSYAYMWKAFFECEENAAEYRRCSAICGANVDVVGYVKMDAYASVKPERHARKRILVALHHSVEGGTNKTLSLANFIGYADFFAALPDRYPEIDFVFRPHPFLFKVLVNRKIWSPERLDAYVARLKAKPNVIWSEGGDYFREFAESDGCIQDCGSFLVEYFYTGKPCCYMLKQPEDIASKFSPLGQKCLGACYVAYDTDAIDAFVRDVVVAGKDVRRDVRKDVAAAVMVNYPHAARTALEHIMEALA